MYELKKNGKVFTSKFVGTGPSSYEKWIYRDAVSQRLRNTALDELSGIVSYMIYIQLMIYSRNPFIRINWDGEPLG